MKKIEDIGKNTPQKGSICERILIIRENFFEGINNKMAQALDTHPSIVSKLITGERPVTCQIVEKLLNMCPELDPDWLLTGRGTMQRPTVQVTNNSGNVAAINNGQQTIADTRLLDTIASQQDTIAKQAEQVSQLIALLAKQQ